MFFVMFCHLCPYAFGIYDLCSGHKSLSTYGPKCEYHLVQHPAAVFLSLSLTFAGCRQRGWMLRLCLLGARKMPGFNAQGLNAHCALGLTPFECKYFALKLSIKLKLIYLNLLLQTGETQQLSIQQKIPHQELPYTVHE